LIINVPDEAYSQHASCMCPKMDPNILLRVMGLYCKSKKDR